MASPGRLTVPIIFVQLVSELLFLFIEDPLGDDAQALIWDVSNMHRPVDDPILAYSAGGEVSQVHWGAAHTNWIAIVFNKSLEILRV